MLHVNPELTHLDGALRGAFSTVFEQSSIPMALVDGDRRYVKVNEAVVRLYQYPVAELLGNRAGRTIVGSDPSSQDAEWERLLRTNELYGERVVTHANGDRMRVSYAAHGTTVGERWLALFVTVSARSHPGGPELIGTAFTESPRLPASKLTAREREIVKLVALGHNTRRIAAELCLSPATVRSHVGNAMAKTGAHTRAQLVAQVLVDGLADS